eukprot:TRINITY_DN419_c0_g2_i1.p1 TRINITY_DN419_c0_g2~~TRINITY_DN419_c0_g2_i1.p1  ORF type:complete len:351 (-),score=53.57 TRINITY_DN419_c0_g2_i1:219-1271(-)
MPTNEIESIVGTWPSEMQFAYYESTYFVPLVYAVLEIITCVFLGKAIKNYISCSSKNKLKYQRIVILYTFSVVFILADCLSLVLFDYLRTDVNYGVAVTVVVSIFCYFGKFLFLIYMWIELVLGQNPSVQSHTLYKRRKVIFAICVVLILFGVVFQVATMFDPRSDLQYAGIAVLVFFTLCVAIVFTIVAILLFRLMKNLKNTEKGRRFRKRLTILASFFIVFLYFYIAFYLVFLNYRIWALQPVFATILFQNVPEFGCVIVVLWFLNPFRRNGSNGKGEKNQYSTTTPSGSGSDGAQTNNNNGGKNVESGMRAPENSLDSGGSAMELESRSATEHAVITVAVDVDDVVI